MTDGTVTNMQNIISKHSSRNIINSSLLEGVIYQKEKSSSVSSHIDEHGGEGSTNDLGGNSTSGGGGATGKLGDHEFGPESSFYGETLVKINPAKFDNVKVSGPPVYFVDSHWAVNDLSQTNDLFTNDDNSLSSFDTYKNKIIDMGSRVSNSRTLASNASYSNNNDNNNASNNANNNNNDNTDYSNGAPLVPSNKGALNIDAAVGIALNIDAAVGIKSREIFKSSGGVNSEGVGLNGPTYRALIPANRTLGVSADR